MKANSFIKGLILCYFICPTISFSQTVAKDGKEFPVPKDIKNLIFYVQRTNNINTLIYEFNYDADGELNTENPVKVYWKNYNIDGSTEPLNALQRKYAYGVESFIADAAKKTFYFHLVSYKKQEIYLIKSPTTNKYEAFINLNNRLIEITRVYIHIEGGAFWTPKIKYLDVFGMLPNSKKIVVERVIP